MTYAEQIAVTLSVRPHQVQAAMDLLDGGNTLPFVARYRKEATDGLDEEQLRQIAAQSESLRNLDERRAAILASISEQGKLSDELNARLQAATTRTELEDLYQPYRPRRRTRAGVARERGLQPLADLILAQPTRGPSPEEAAQPFLGEQIPTLEEALAGARDIVAETVTDHPEVRQRVREKALRWALLSSTLIEGAQDERNVYRDYYAYEQRVDRLRPHQILAINRGEQEKILRVRVAVPERDWRQAVERSFRPHPHSPFAQQLTLAVEDGASRLLLPAMERDVRRTMSESAQQHAIQIFADNLRALLSQPPLAGHVVLGLDPAYRTGCKVAVVDATGRLLETTTIYPHPPQKQSQAAQTSLLTLIQRHRVTLITIGNGTASRETEQLVADLIRRQAPHLHYLMVNEAGASVYSASPLARQELPDLDVSLRGAVSIARRAQDPLAELVKIDPKAIGVGLYQHDVDQKELAASLDGVVESVVNQVGVELNTASPALLTYVSGIGPTLARAIAAYRDNQGPFPDRTALRQVSGLGPKAFEQAAGFLRVRDSRNPLDATAIHPESYPVAHALLAQTGMDLTASSTQRQEILEPLTQPGALRALAVQLQTGAPTLTDILEQLAQPGRDPRADLPLPLLRQDVLAVEDLLVGQRLMGTVRNVVDFGAFVDIGVKQDGLLHRSRIPTGESYQVGDVIEVEILSIDSERGRIGLGI